MLGLFSIDLVRFGSRVQTTYVRFSVTAVGGFSVGLVWIEEVVAVEGCRDCAGWDDVVPAMFDRAGHERAELRHGRCEPP
jgi:hypothetical protein